MEDFSNLGIENDSSVTIQTIENVEREIGISLPKAYKQFVLYNDEASPEVCAFNFGEDETCISEFFKFTDDASYPYSIMSYIKNQIPGLPKLIIPIARDAGDFLICLDLRDGNQNIVVYEPNEQKLIFVTETFDEFLDQLKD